LTKNSDGILAVEFTPPKKGLILGYIFINNQLIGGRPYFIKVEGKSV
jgi:hypothetical protein